MKFVAKVCETYVTVIYSFLFKKSFGLELHIIRPENLENVSSSSVNISYATSVCVAEKKLDTLVCIRPYG